MAFLSNNTSVSRALRNERTYYLPEMDHIGHIWEFLKAVSDKDSTGYASPQELSSYLGVAQLTVFNAYRASGVLNNLTGSAVAPFIVDAPFTSSALGVFAKPSNFVQVERIEAGGKEYLPILFNELRDARISQLYPLERYPRYMEQGASVKLFPERKVTGTLTYLRLPATPVIGFTIVDGSPVYSSGTSVQLEMPKAFWPRIIKETLPYLGVNLSDGELAALSQTMQTAT